MFRFLLKPSPGSSYVVFR